MTSIAAGAPSGAITTLTPTLQFNIDTSGTDLQVYRVLGEVRRVSDDLLMWSFDVTGQQFTIPTNFVNGSPTSSTTGYFPLTGVLYAGTALVSGTAYKWRVTANFAQGSPFYGFSVAVNNAYQTFTPTVSAPVADTTSVVWLSSVIQTNSAEKTNKQANIGYSDMLRQTVQGLGLTVPGNYDWRIQVFDDGGLSSGWSPRQTFKLVVAAPGAPTNLAPQGITATNFPTFSGTFVPGSDGTITSVTIELYINNGATLLWRYVYDTTSSSWSVPWPGDRTVLTPGQTYSWRAATTDSYGLIGAFSSFLTISTNSVPGAPITLSPVTTIGKVFPNGVPPTFAGTHVSSTNIPMDMSEVTVTYSDNSTWVSRKAEDGTTTRFKTIYTGRTLNPGEHVTWTARTRAQDSGIWGPSCAPQTLYINNTPASATNLTPSGDANVVGASTTLTWTANLGDSVSRVGGVPDGLSQVFYYLDLLNSDTATSVGGYPVLTASIFDDFESPMSAWTQSGGVWTSTGGYAVTTGSNDSIAYQDPGIADYNMGAYVLPASLQRVGLIFRMVDTSNYLSATLLDGSLLIQKTIAGVVTTIRTLSVDYVNGYWQHLDIQVSDLTYQIMFNGALVGNENISDAAINSGQIVGLYADNTANGAFNDFYVASLSAGDSTYNPSADLTDETRYSWTVRSYDGYALGPYCSQATFQNVDAPVVEVTSPANLDTISSPTPVVEWTYTPSGGRAQQQFAVRVLLSNSVVYDSGVQFGTALFWQIPSGTLLNGKSYRIVVQVWDTLNLTSSSTPIVITTSWTPPDTIDNFQAVADDDTGDVDLTWNSSTLSSGFLFYNLYIVDSEGSKTLIQQISDISTLNYTYSFAPSGVISFIITQTQEIGSDLVDSGEVEATVSMDFRTAWISDTIDPSFKVGIMDNPARSFTWTRDEVDKRYWGNTKTTRSIGRGLYRTFSVGGQLIGSSIAEDDESDMVEMLRTLIRRKNIVCYRDGRGRKIFANFALQEEDQMPYTFTVTLTMVEAEYTEAVT